MSQKSIEQRSITKGKFLGDFALSAFHFENLDSVMEEFRTAEYKKLNHTQKSERVNRKLLELILQAPKDSFLLIAVVEYIDQIFRKDLLINYTLISFELWLNQFSGLPEEENYFVRSKIVGKRVPRDEYQILFPIGMGKVHPGSHFVTAHSSPDLDTTVASFWGWVDAFGARVAEGVHVWNVPGGPPSSSIEVALLFYHIFGQNLFHHLAKTRTTLALSSLELMTQRGVFQEKTDRSSVTIDHERTQKAVILVDGRGYFLGDWRSIDVEGVRQVVMLLNNCLRFFENHLHAKIVSLFAKKDLTVKDLPPFIKEVFDISIKNTAAAHELTERQQRYIEGYLHKVLKVEKGLDATFGDFATSMNQLGIPDFQDCMNRIQSLQKSGLFDSQGKLIEDRSQIFTHFEEIISLLDQAIQKFRLYTERLEVALHIKTEVFGYLPQVVSYRADVEELRSKMGNYPYLTVTSVDEEGRMLPLGVVRALDLHKPILGTVSLRDFCNREETKIPSYFEVISVIDHHKSSLQTSAPSVIYVSDSQSSNTLVAQLAFAINDKYSTNGMTLLAIEEQIKKVRPNLSSEGNVRILQRLLKRSSAVLEQKRNPGAHFIDPLREFVEYIHFLYAILDDTDLLTKVSKRDVECVAELLNRLKSLVEGEEVEIIHFDDLPYDRTFVEKAASRILQHPDMYSLYRKIYLAKEQLVEENLKFCLEGKDSTIFLDTKIQNGCCRVGQTKVFANNFSSLQKYRARIRQIWAQQALAAYTDKREVDLHMHMLSTIAGAEDLFSGKEVTFTHQDELWFWVPMTEQSIEHLKGFLNAFRASPQIKEQEKSLEIEFVGPNGKELLKIFRESFLPVNYRFTENKGEELSLAVLYYPAGTLNSRKAMISPYLPQVIS